MQCIKRLLQRNAVCARLASDYGYRTVLFTFFSLAINTFAGIMKLCSALVLRSLWYGALGGYYIVLGGARYLLLRSAAQSAGMPSGARRERMMAGVSYRSGLSLIVLTLAFFAAVWQMVFAGQAFRYPPEWILPAAGMALYKIAFALLQLYRVKQMNRQLLLCIRQLNCADALVSLVSLQTAVFFALGAQLRIYQRTLNALSGTVVCILILCMGIQTTLSARAVLRQGEEGPTEPKE
ncbi:MAG: hypothetical protein SOV91_05240 [Eubacteriales bacterium]|nr:hypothetical protein [Eubacteriales bacterium]